MNFIDPQSSKIEYHHLFTSLQVGPDAAFHDSFKVMIGLRTAPAAKMISVAEPATRAMVNGHKGATEPRSEVIISREYRRSTYVSSDEYRVL